MFIEAKRLRVQEYRYSFELSRIRTLERIRTRHNKPILFFGRCTFLGRRCFRMNLLRIWVAFGSLADLG